MHLTQKLRIETTSHIKSDFILSVCNTLAQYSVGIKQKWLNLKYIPSLFPGPSYQDHAKYIMCKIQSCTPL